MIASFATVGGRPATTLATIVALAGMLVLSGCGANFDTNSGAGGRLVVTGSPTDPGSSGDAGSSSGSGDTEGSGSSGGSSDPDVSDTSGGSSDTDGSDSSGGSGDTDGSDTSGDSGDTDGSDTSDNSSPTYTLAATVSGLHSSGLVLSVNAAVVAVSDTTTNLILATGLASGTDYSVTINTQPAGESCSIAGGHGTITSADVANIVVTCADLAFALGGSINGLNTGGLMLANGTDTVAIASGATTFTLPNPVAHSSNYSVTVQTQPAGQTCIVSNGTGTATADVTNIAIACTAWSTFTTTILHSFAGSAAGAYPSGNLIQASDGDLYGTTFQGGNGANQGTVYKLTLAGSASIVHRFAQTNALDAVSPNYAGVVQAADGNFYGVSRYGGTTFTGAVFKLTPAGVETVSYSFAGGTDGANPMAGLIEASDGNFYGTTAGGGTYGQGTAFKVTPDGTATLLHSFAGGSDGAYPTAELIQASDGNFYGTTTGGGTYGQGTVFKLTAGGSETIVYSFAGGPGDGGYPYASLIQASDGNLYGTTFGGGAHGQGTVFKLTPAGSETILYAFAGAGDGANPYSGLIQAADGNLYGTTQAGGDWGGGTVFRLTPSGGKTILYCFGSTTTDGATPSGPLLQSSDGSFYGSTYYGGLNGGSPVGYGTVFRITPH